MQAVTMSNTDFIECAECGDPATGMASDLGNQSYRVCRPCGHRIFFDYAELPVGDLELIGLDYSGP